ncbi:hypothetical protein T11_17061, partial [Trichinella zimbabwensis]
LSNSAVFGIIVFSIFCIVCCKISLEWHEALNAVLCYALALRGGGEEA